MNVIRNKQPLSAITTGCNNVALGYKSICYAGDYSTAYSDRVLIDNLNVGTYFFDQDTRQMKVWDGVEWMVLADGESTINREIENWVDCPRCGGTKIQNSKCDWCGM